MKLNHVKHVLSTYNSHITQKQLISINITKSPNFPNFPKDVISPFTLQFMVETSSNRNIIPIYSTPKEYYKLKSGF